MTTRPDEDEGGEHRDRREGARKGGRGCGVDWAKEAERTRRPVRKGKDRGMGDGELEMGTGHEGPELVWAGLRKAKKNSDRKRSFSVSFNEKKSNIRIPLHAHEETPQWHSMSDFLVLDVPHTFRT